MTPFSLLPHWFQRRYRVWRGCGKGEHRDTLREYMGVRGVCRPDPDWRGELGGGLLWDDVPELRLEWHCLDCRRAVLILPVAAGSNSAKWRDA